MSLSSLCLVSIILPGIVGLPIEDQPTNAFVDDPVLDIMSSAPRNLHEKLSMAISILPGDSAWCAGSSATSMDADTDTVDNQSGAEGASSFVEPDGLPHHGRARVHAWLSAYAHMSKR